MTPMLVLLFGVDPLSAVSSDIVASLVMKPIGGAVHLRRGTVHTGLVRWLVLGSVPSAFAGVLLLQALGGDAVSERLKIVLGAALLVAASSIVVKALLESRRRAAAAPSEPIEGVQVRPLATLLIGIVGGVVVGMTSVGSGSVMIVLLLLTYPSLTAGSLVGTDLVQAVPLVGSAAVGHLLFGEFELALATSVLLGSIPGVYAGARLSARSSNPLVRPALVVVLLASGLKLVDVDMAYVVGALGGFVLFGAAMSVRSLVVARRRLRVTG
jgi:uncharacterized membrane protein YfcA